MEVVLNGDMKRLSELDGAPMMMAWLGGLCGCREGSRADGRRDESASLWRRADAASVTLQYIQCEPVREAEPNCK